MTYQNLYIARTEESPEFSYSTDSCLIKISGRSLLENPFVYYSEVLEWMKSFVDQLDFPVTIEIFLDYFNSSSGRYLLEFLMVAEQKSHLFDVRWLVESDDEVMLEKGNEFKYILSMPMKMVMVDQ